MSDITGPELFRRMNPVALPWERQSSEIQSVYTRAAESLARETGQEGSTVGYTTEPRRPSEHITRARVLMRDAQVIKERIARIEQRDFATEGERRDRLAEQREALAEVWREATFHATMGSTNPDVYVQAMVDGGEL